MQKRLVTIAMGVLSIPALGVAAYGVAHSVSDSPSPQVVVPASSQSPDGGANGPATGVRRADDPATHSGTTPSVPGHGAGPGSDSPISRDSVSTTLGHRIDGTGHDVPAAQGGLAPPATTNDGSGGEHSRPATTTPTRATTATSVSGSPGGGGPGGGSLNGTGTTGGGPTSGGQGGGSDNPPGHH